MINTNLIDLVEELKLPKYKWIELSHIVGANTPHWIGFKPLSYEKALDYHEDPFHVIAYSYNIVGQYGTHIDCPAHFVNGGRTLENVDVKNTILPLCVINVSDKVKLNHDYALSVEDILKWENNYGEIPKNSFVAMRSDWSIISKGDYENNDEEGNPHYPGWSIEALKYLVEKRDIAAIGHETTDTDSPGIGLGWIGELYILKQDKFQIEVMTNLDKVPEYGGLIICAWPRIEKGVGFPARCFAIFED